MVKTLGFDGASHHEEEIFVEVAPETEELRIRRNAMLTEGIRILRPIAAGGMGSVWLADHLGLQIPVAVKFLRSSLATHPGAIQRFQREAAAAARIRSAHVVQVLDHGVAAGQVPYIVMELLEGQTLDALLTERTKLTLRETVEIVRQAGRVLAKAHEIGIIHRDIKPENLFLVDGMRPPFVKVLDFGIAKNCEDEGRVHITSEGSVVGTPQYMSPEQMTGHGNVGPASDVWSLGVVAYACLTGIMPYAGTSLAEIAVAIDRGEIIRASALSNEVTDEVDLWLRRALDPSLDHRFRTAPEMISALEEAVASPAPISGSRVKESARPIAASDSSLANPMGPSPEELFYGRRFRPRTTWRMRGWMPLSGVLAALVFMIGILAYNRSTNADSLGPTPAMQKIHIAVPTLATRAGTAVSLPRAATTSESIPVIARPSPQEALARPSREPGVVRNRRDFGD